jgi:hypothetical protein
VFNSFPFNSVAFNAIPTFATMATVAAHPTISASAGDVVPVYVGSASLTSSHATISASATRRVPYFSGPAINRGFKDMILIKLNEATAGRRRIPFDLTSSTDFVTPLTGQTVALSAIKVYPNGGSEATATGSVVEIGGGLYYYECATGEVATLGQLTVRVNFSGALPYKAVGQVVSFDPYDATGLGLSGMNINLTQTVPIVDLSTKTTQNVGECFSAARAQGAGKWILSGTTLTLYGPDGTVVRTFPLNDAVNPTQRG